MQVHLAGVGDFQLKQIDLVEDPCPLRQQKRQHASGESMQVEDESSGQKVSHGRSSSLKCIRLVILLVFFLVLFLVE